MPPHLRDSILNGKGYVAGFIGQAICCKHMGAKRADERHSHFDIFERQIGRVEVKTKQCNTPPEPHYLCSVACANDRQECHAYAFMRVNYNQLEAWFLGWLPREEFRAQAFKLLRGECDPEDPGYKVRADCWNVRASKLYPFPPTKLGLPQEYFWTIPKP